MESAVGSEQPPRNLIEMVRRRHRRHVARVAAAGVAAAAVVAGLVPASARVLGHSSGPAAGHRTTASTVYVSFDYKQSGRVVTINPATNRPGQPINLNGDMAITPNGKTLYVTTAPGPSRSAPPPTSPASRSTLTASSGESRSRTGKPPTFRA
jgi:hypothetical protein